jgi:hypothetical protein
MAVSCGEGFGWQEINLSLKMSCRIWTSVFELILHRFSLWLKSAETNYSWTIMAYRFA